MSVVSIARRAFAKQIVDHFNGIGVTSCQVQSVRSKYILRELPQPGVQGKSYRRIVHFKDKYTVEPLEVTNLAGRDPESGRVVAKGIGGGIKHKYHWIKWDREGPTDLDEPPKEEKVLDIIVDGCRTAHIALVGSGKELKYILATKNMKPGDILRTHQGLPPNPRRVKEGDAFPLGAMPSGTVVNCVEKYPGEGATLIHAAGTSGTVLRHTERGDVVVKMPSKKEFILDRKCMATVGQLSNLVHSSTPIGSAQRLRELGYRPRSGLWQRKTGRLGRKIKPPPKPEKKVLTPPTFRGVIELAPYQHK